MFSPLEKAYKKKLEARNKVGEVQIDKVDFLNFLKEARGAVNEKDRMDLATDSELEKVNEKDEVRIAISENLEQLLHSEHIIVRRSILSRYQVTLHLYNFRVDESYT